MANPLYNGGANFNNTGNNALMQNITNVIQFAKGQKNPQALIQQMVSHNPQAAQMLNQLQQNGQSPKDMVMSILKQRGIDPEQIMKQLK